MAQWLITDDWWQAGLEAKVKSSNKWQITNLKNLQMPVDNDTKYPYSIGRMLYPHPVLSKNIVLAVSNETYDMNDMIIMKHLQFM